VYLVEFGDGSEDGIALAKDSWLLAIGLSLIGGGLSPREG
jgi:hypothetical protein